MLVVNKNVRSDEHLQGLEMGSYLSQPITEKISADGQNEYISFGSSSMQGWRLAQEVYFVCFATLRCLSLSSAPQTTEFASSFVSIKFRYWTEHNKFSCVFLSGSCNDDNVFFYRTLTIAVLNTVKTLHSSLFMMAT